MNWSTPLCSSRSTPSRRKKILVLEVRQWRWKFYIILQPLYSSWRAIFLVDGCNCSYTTRIGRIREQEEDVGLIIGWAEWGKAILQVAVQFFPALSKFFREKIERWLSLPRKKWPVIRLWLKCLLFFNRLRCLFDNFRLFRSSHTGSLIQGISGLHTPRVVRRKAPMGSRDKAPVGGRRTKSPKSWWSFTQ